MRLARVICAHDQPDQAIDSLLAAEDLDLLQLDYCWQNSGEAHRRMYSTGFFKQLRELHKALFLNPQLHLITNAGGGAVADCVESLCQQLCELGSSDMLVTGIRGANLLPRLEELSAQGIELIDTESGRSLLEISKPIISANAELGGGPIATALAEGSRIVVAGAYDATAPFLAAAVREMQWSWDDSQRLANLAAAVYLARSGEVIDLKDQVAEEISITSNGLPPTGSKEETSISNSEFKTADVVVDCSRLQFQPDGHGSWKIRNATGAPSIEWLLRAGIIDAFESSVLIKLRGGNALKQAEEIQSKLSSLLLNPSGSKQTSIVLLKVQDNNETFWVQAVCRSEQQNDCELFLRDLSNFLVRNDSGHCYEFLTPPSIRPVIKEFLVPISRDAIDISVDTRPAHQWT